MKNILTCINIRLSMNIEASKSQSDNLLKYLPGHLLYNAMTVNFANIDLKLPS